MKRARRGWAVLIASGAFAALPAQDTSDAYMRSLALAGNVQVMHGRVSDPGLDANTRFELSVQANWEFDVSLQKRGNDLELVVTPDFKRIDVGVRHFILLPDGESLDSPRYRTLLLHEYDHIAISSDERPRILLRSLIRGMGPLHKAWSGGLPDGQANAMISAEIEVRKAAMVKLIENAYQKLDEISDHGRKAIPSRVSFFPSLFSASFLKDAKFAYSAAAERAAGSAEYQTARRYYRL